MKTTLITLVLVALTAAGAMAEGTKKSLAAGEKKNFLTAGQESLFRNGLLPLEGTLTAKSVDEAVSEAQLEQHEQMNLERQLSPTDKRIIRYQLAQQEYIQHSLERENLRPLAR